MTFDEVLADMTRRVQDDPESVAYLRAHRRRYRILLDRVDAALAGTAAPRVLDVGPSYECELMRRLVPDARIDSLGFEDGRLLGARDGERHIDYDLVDAGDAATWPAAGPYDLIVCAEVIEHLYTAPVLTLRLLASLLRPGDTLLLQTPNAAALSRRFWLLTGRNPFEPIRADLHQAGHFREYTAAELRSLCAEAGFRVVHVELENYFLTGSRKNRVVVALGPVTPPTLRQGITLVAERT
jgi:trans-aconitate methyltransferase